MKSILLVFALAMGTIQGIAQTKQAEMSFDKETHDYGEITTSDDGNCIFTFTNTGNAPLIISNAKGSCNCTVPSWPKEPIAPGESGEIKVHYNTKRVGPINKSVYISSNAGDFTLRIRGKVSQGPGAPEKVSPQVRATN